MRRGDTEELIRLLAGELPPPEAAALSARMAREPELAAAFRRLETAWRAAEPAPAGEVPAWFAVEVMQRVRREAAGPVPLTWSAVPLRVRAAGAAALVAGLALGAGLATLRQAASGGAAPRPALPPIEIAEGAEPLDGPLGGSLAEAYLDAVAAAGGADGGGDGPAGRGRS